MSIDLILQKMIEPVNTVRMNPSITRFNAALSSIAGSECTALPAPSTRDHHHVEGRTLFVKLEQLDFDHAMHHAVQYSIRVIRKGQMTATFTCMILTHRLSRSLCFHSAWLTLSDLTGRMSYCSI